MEPESPPPRDTSEPPGASDSSIKNGDPGHEEFISSEPGGLTLEQIIDMTGEFEHLNELVLEHLEKSGGYTDTDTYFNTVQPVLDMLEIEIRVKCQRDTTCQQMKLIVQDWIDQELRGFTAVKPE